MSDDARRVLVVDDVPVNRLLAVKLLSKSGWQVGEAEDGPAALAWLAANPAPLHVILLDISMPQMSGQELCHIIREQGLGGTDVKVIAYTAHAMPEDAAAFRADGFDGVLVKPINRSGLNEALIAVGYGL